MLHNLKHLHFLAVLMLLLSATSARAITFMEVESTYEGDGWFRYTLRFPTDQFTPFARIGDFFPKGFGPAAEVSTPPDWTFQSDETGIAWIAPNPIIRPATYVFRARSTLRHFKQITNISSLIVRTAPESPPPAFGGEMTGFAFYNVLIPCLPEESDNTVNPFVKRLELRQDLRIESVLREDEKIRGIRLNWGLAAAYAVEASADLSSWHSVREFVSDGTIGTQYFPEITDPGPFYRVKLTGYDPPQYILLKASTQNDPPQRLLKGVKIESGENGPEAVFPSSKGLNYTVQFLSVFGETKKIVTVAGADSSTRVIVPADLSGQPVLVRIADSSVNTR